MVPIELLTRGQFFLGRFSAVFRLGGALPPKMASRKLAVGASKDPTGQSWPSLEALLGARTFIRRFQRYLVAFFWRRLGTDYRRHVPRTARRVGQLLAP